MPGNQPKRKYVRYSGSRGAKARRVTRSRAVLIDYWSESDDGGIGSLAPTSQAARPVRIAPPMRKNSSPARSRTNSGIPSVAKPTRQSYPLRNRSNDHESLLHEDHENINNLHAREEDAVQSVHDEEIDPKSSAARKQPRLGKGLNRELENLKMNAKEQYGSDAVDLEISLQDKVKARARRSQHERERRAAEEDDEHHDEEDDEEEEEDHDDEDHREDQACSQENSINTVSEKGYRLRRKRVEPDRYGKQDPTKRLRMVKPTPSLFTKSGAHRSSLGHKKARHRRKAEESASSSSDEEHFQKKKHREMEKSRSTMLPMNLDENEVNHRHGFRDRERIGASLADVDPMAFDKSITFESVGGHPDAIRQLKEMVVLPLLYPTVFQKFSVTPPRGVLFYGPPGTGKTLMARALANECSQDGKRVAFFMRKGSDVLSKWVGESERQLRLLFDQAFRMRPSIIFFDEIDGLAPVRSSRQDHIHSSIVSTLLALMDGLDSRGEVIVIGATNRIDSIDPALRRPGRFDREILFPLPSAEARMQILKIHSSKWEPRPSDDFFKTMSLKTNGYCGADLKALCTDAVLNSIRRTYPVVYRTNQKINVNDASIEPNQDDFINAMKTIVPSSVRSDSSAAIPLDSYCQPLLIGKFKTLLKQMELNWPRVQLKCKTFDHKDTRNELFGQSSSSWHQFVVFSPRLLITGPAKNGQNMIAQALLDSMDNMKIIKITLPSLYACSTRTVEDTLAENLREASRAGQAVLYIPNVEDLWEGLTEACRSIFVAMINSMPYHQPTYIIFTSSHPNSKLPKEIEDMVKSAKSRFTVDAPSKEELADFFACIKSTCIEPVKSFATEAKSVLQDVFYKEIPVRKMSTPEVDKLEENEESTMRTLRIFLRNMVTRLAQDKRFKEFLDPVEPDDLPDYHNIIENSMDLSTIMCKIDAHEYQTVGELLVDINRICDNALEYNPTTYAEERMIRHRACLLKDFAYELVEHELDPEFEKTCREIKIARKLRGGSKRQFAPEYVQTSGKSPEEIQKQQEEIRARDINAELAEGDKIWALHNDTFYMGRLIRINKNLHPEEPFYVHFVNFNKRHDEWLDAARLRYRLGTDDISDCVKSTVKKKRKRRSDWSSGIIRKTRSRRHQNPDDHEILDIDETTRESFIFGDNENSNDSNKENVPVGIIEATEPNEVEIDPESPPKFPVEETKMDMTPSVAIEPEEPELQSPEDPKKVLLTDVWTTSELDLARNEVDRLPEAIIIDHKALDQVFERALESTIGSVVEDILRLGAAMNSVIYKYRDVSDRRSLPQDLISLIDET